jgi:hypothetical protein
MFAIPVLKFGPVSAPGLPGSTLTMFNQFVMRYVPPSLSMSVLPNWLLLKLNGPKLIVEACIADAHAIAASTKPTNRVLIVTAFLR